MSNNTLKVGELLEILKNCPPEYNIQMPVNTPGLVKAVPPEETKHDIMEKYCPVQIISTIEESVESSMGTIPSSNEAAKEFAESFNEIIKNDDNSSAMSNKEMRGPIAYHPENFEEQLPVMLRYNAMVQRSNNTDTVNALIDIDEHAKTAIARIDEDIARLQKLKNLINENAKMQKYRTLLEYNSQCDMHNQAAFMAQMVMDINNGSNSNK